MPIGTLDIPVAAGSATNLVNALFDSPAGTPLARPFLSPLMQAANTTSAQNYLGGPAVPFVNVPLAAGALAAAPAATAVPNPAVAPVQTCVSLLNPPELQAMIAMWWAIWNTAPAAAAPAGSNPSDVAMLTTLRDYIASPDGGAVSPPLSMWVPTLGYDGMAGDKLKLRVLAYNQIVLAAGGAGAPIVWNQANVTAFLQYFAFGAHFVAIHATGDLPAPPALLSFYTVFGNALGAQSGWARMNSHYSGLGGLNTALAAYAYPSLINAEIAPANCPYIAALLVGRTAWSVLGGDYNTFFQLEGWPATGYLGASLFPRLSIPPVGVDGGRHGADFATHNATKWNISTYGASVFSEKRGTAIFLAPPVWAPQPNANSIMAPYVGAATAQGWLDQTLVRL